MKTDSRYRVHEFAELARHYGQDAASLRSKAWADRDHWPASLKRRLEEFDIERATRFIADALWVRWADQQDTTRQRRGPGVPRVSDSRRALFEEWAMLLDSDPRSQQAQELLTRWQSLLDVESNGDEGVKADTVAFVSRRHSWPPGMQRYMASLYDSDVDRWSRVIDFIEQTLAYKTSDGRPSHPDASLSRRSDAPA